MSLIERIASWIDRVTGAQRLCIGCGTRAAERDTPMVEGPEFVICEKCATEASALVGRTGPGAAYPDNDQLTRCHFCGTSREAADGLVGWPRGAICKSCLELSRELFRKRPA